MSTELETIDAKTEGVFENLRTGSIAAAPLGVDDEARVIRGRVVAQAGDFKTKRGHFTNESLKHVVALIKAQPDGMQALYGHHEGDMLGSAALDAFIGRDKNPRIDGDKVRTDLHLDPVAFLSTNGGASIGERLMLRAKTDPQSFGSSMVLAVEKKFRLDNRGHKMLDELGNVLPPIWLPTKIKSIDVVADGDAVHGGFLAAVDTLQPGDAVQWLCEDAAEMSAELCTGIVEEVAGDGSEIAIAGTSLTLAGPAARVKELEEDEWYLIELSRLSKVVLVSEVPQAGCDMPASSMSNGLSAGISASAIGDDGDDELTRLRWQNAKRKAGAA